MKTIKGPAIFLAQFADDEAPFNSLASIGKWAADLGFVGVQIPSWDERLFDLQRAAESKTYCDEINGMLGEHGVAITELSTHLQGQLVAVHPAYDSMFDPFAAETVRGNPTARQAWAVDQLKLAARASQNLGLSAHATFSGALAWPYFYPWPQRPAGLVEEVGFSPVVGDLWELCGRHRPCPSQGLPHRDCGWATLTATGLPTFSLPAAPHRTSCGSTAATDRLSQSQQRCGTSPLPRVRSGVPSQTSTVTRWGGAGSLVMLSKVIDGATEKATELEGLRSPPPSGSSVRRRS